MEKVILNLFISYKYILYYIILPVWIWRINQTIITITKHTITSSFNIKFNILNINNNQ